MKKLILLILCSVFFCTGFSQGTDTISPLSQKLKIGIYETPPFVMQDDDKYSGVSVESWKLVNKKLKTDYTFKKFNSLGDLLNAVKKGEVDFSINPITVTDKRMQDLSFSQPYFISHTAIAKQKESKAWEFIKNLVSWKFFTSILLLVGILLFFGFLVWVFERHKNEEEFGGKGWRGIGEGFWWSAVTMTTVGYGDRSPRTLGGRIVGLVWMFAAIIMISSLTASIASALTVNSISNKISSTKDLKEHNVTTVKTSSAEELLNIYGVKAKTVSNEKEGVQNILDNKTKFFVYDQPILDYEIKRRDLADEVIVLPKTLKKDYYSYSFPKKSTLIKKINPILISSLKTLRWQNIIENYQ